MGETTEEMGGVVDRGRGENWVEDEDVARGN